MDEVLNSLEIPNNIGFSINLDTFVSFFDDIKDRHNFIRKITKKADFMSQFFSEDFHNYVISLSLQSVNGKKVLKLDEKIGITKEEKEKMDKLSNLDKEIEEKEKRLLVIEDQLKDREEKTKNTESELKEMIETYKNKVLSLQVEMLRNIEDVKNGLQISSLNEKRKELK